MTDSSGLFALTGSTGAPVSLQVSKSQDTGGAIGVLDAVYVLGAVVGILPLSAPQLLACDVSGDGSVTLLDAVSILQYTVGLIQRFPVADQCGWDWMFVPDPTPIAGEQPVQPQVSTCRPGSITFPSLTDPTANQNFVGVLIGDCSGDWQPAPGGPPTSSTPSPTPTATSAPTLTGTATWTASALPTQTATVNTPSPTPTATSTSSPTRSATRTATTSPTPTLTASPTPVSNARPLGTVTLLSTPTPCAGDSCYTVEVRCAGLPLDDATLKVAEPSTQPERGTILFATGFTGTFFWETLSSEAPRVLMELQASGFRTVQLKWLTNWFLAPSGKVEGQALLACRPASAARWVYDHIHVQSPDTAFCAAGDSNGASQIAYMLAQYGLAGILSAVEMDGGPNWARIDTGCLWNDSALQALWFDQSTRNNADWAFGFPDNGSGPCGLQTASYRSTFQSASLALGNWQYVYPKTLVHFLFGDQDATSTAGQGMYYYDWLQQQGTPLLQLDFVPNTPHTVVSTTQGADMLRDALLDGCQPH